MSFALNPATVLGPEFYGFLLPWIFTFAIVYGLLSKLTLFGSDKSPKINIALSFVIAFFVTASAGPQLASFFINLFGGAATYLAGILVILLFISMVGFKMENANHIVVVLILVVIGALLFIGSTGAFVGSVVIGSDIAVLVFWLIIIAAAVYMITKGGGGGGGSGGGGSP